MEYQENIREIVEALSEALACSPLEAEEDGRIMFGLDDDMGAVLFPEGAEELGREVISATIVIGKPDVNDRELLLDMLEGNYFGELSGDGTLAIDKQSGLLVLFRIFELPMSASFFVDAFANLVGAARLWRERLSRPSEVEAPLGEMLRV